MLQWLRQMNDLVGKVGKRQWRAYPTRPGTYLCFLIFTTKETEILKRWTLPPSYRSTEFHLSSRLHRGPMSSSAGSFDGGTYVNCYPVYREAVGQCEAIGNLGKANHAHWWTRRLEVLVDFRGALLWMLKWRCITWILRIQGA